MVGFLLYLLLCLVAPLAWGLLAAGYLRRRDRSAPRPVAPPTPEPEYYL